MKKLLFLITMALLFPTIAWSQNWVPLTKTEPAEPEIAIIQSDNRQVGFTVELSGFFSTLITEARVNYQRLSISGYGVTGETGTPEIPVIRKRIAIPVCDKIHYSVQVIESQILAGYRVYPVPKLQPDTTGMLQEVFTIKPSVYLQNAPIPAESYLLGETGALRHQHYVELEIHPIQFNPVTEQLQVATAMEIILTFDKPVTDVNVPTGIFNKVAATSFMNYKDNGWSAIMNDKAFEKDGFKPGNVEWINLIDTAQACQITADYLIITVPEFFTPNDPHSQLIRLANHRAYYNGYDVAIVNLEQILELDFYYEGSSNSWEPFDKYIKEQRMRTFIRRVFEGANAHHVGADSCLAFVLLVGDNYGENEGMPTGKEHGIYWFDSSNEIYASDYYFTCITKNAAGKYDSDGDFWIGRFSVEDTTQLFNLVQKNINHETEYSPKFWRETAGSTSAWQFNTMLPTYHNFITNLLDNCGWNYVPVIGLNSSTPLKTPTINYLNAGTAFVQYIDGPSETNNPTSWLDGLNISYFLSELSNGYKAPFINASGSNSAHFDDIECLGEFLTRYDSMKGAVGYIGSTRRNTVMQTFAGYPAILNINLFAENISIAGELLLISKSIESNPEFELIYRYGYNLLGDPALNILAEGYEITRDVSADCPAKITCPVRIHNGATLTVPANCNLTFLAKGKLTIDPNGSMNIADGAQIAGLLCENDTVIHVKGGGFTVGNNVTFNNLNGILLENNKNAQGLPLYDATKQYSINNAIFNNTPLIHAGTRLNISNGTFNQGSNLKSYIGNLNIDSCIFLEASLLSDYTLYVSAVRLALSTTVSNSLFRGNKLFPSSNIYFSGPAIQLNNSRTFSLYNNTITEYEAGIFLSGCGTTLVETSIPDQIVGAVRANEVSNCGTGVEAYNSVVYFRSNHIHENTFGVKLYNNSYTSFNNDVQPIHQIIRDNSSYEIYVSESSFPVKFQYNQIIDEDNLGNDYDDPLVYWDVITPYLGTQYLISWNYWGNEFEPNEDLFPYDAFICSHIWDPSKSASPSPDVPETLYQTALTYFSEEDYPNAELTFKELIETYPNSQFAIAALHELFAIQHFTNQDYFSLHEYYSTITPADSALFNVADFLATRCYVKEKFWQPAVDWYEYRIENPPTYQDSVFAVIDLGDIHLMMEADMVSGTKSGGGRCNYRLHAVKPVSRQGYEENKTTLLATLPQIKKTQTEKPLIPQSGKRGSLGQNIPNPATGTTSIGYEIYTAGAVEINLYNAFGQLVKNMPIGIVQAGSYKTTVSLADLAPGIYHYTLSVNGERTDAKKMVVN